MGPRHQLLCIRTLAGLIVGNPLQWQKHPLEFRMERMLCQHRSNRQPGLGILRILHPMGIHIGMNPNS